MLHALFSQSEHLLYPRMYNVVPENVKIGRGNLPFKMIPSEDIID